MLSKSFERYRFRAKLRATAKDLGQLVHPNPGGIFSLSDIADIVHLRPVVKLVPKNPVNRCVEGTSAIFCPKILEALTVWALQRFLPFISQTSLLFSTPQ